MALPHASEARLFYQTAFQGFEDAEYLLDVGRTTGAMYLAGYSVECILKALILARLTAGRRVAMLASFRGGRAHDFHWLRLQYTRHGGPTIPAAIERHFAYVASWSTDLRYQAGRVKDDDAKRFLRAADAMLTWADGRM